MAKTRGKLVREAKALGLKPLKRHSDAEIVELISQAKQPKKKKKKKKKASLWPTEWDTDSRAAYYLQICKSEMPDDETEAYETLVQTIADLVPDAVPEALETGGYDCKGLYFEPSSQQCTRECPEMPLCRAICEQRPELVQLAAATAETKEDIDKATDDDLRAALAAQAEYEGTAEPAKKKVKKKVKKKRKPNDPIYRWGPHKALRYKEAVDDDELFSVYKWMKKAKWFTRSELVSQFAQITDEAESLADDTIEYLVEDGGLFAKE